MGSAGWERLDAKCVIVTGAGMGIGWVWHLATVAGEAPGEVVRCAHRCAAAETVVEERSWSDGQAIAHGGGSPLGSRMSARR